jgi:hypothetical protein
MRSDVQVRHEGNPQRTRPLRPARDRELQSTDDVGLRTREPVEDPLVTERIGERHSNRSAEAAE